MKTIEVDGITKVIGERVILNNLSFSVNKSRIHGFLGPNGAGKTTTMRILCGLTQATSGQVTIEGLPLAKYSKKLYQKIGFLIEEAPLYPEMTVRDYLAYVAGLRRVADRDLHEHLNYCLEVLDLGDVASRSIENLSRGYKQRVGIAQAIIHRPDIVFLDEPNLGLDPKSITEIRHLIHNLKDQHTVILSSHLLHEMSLVCDDITIISKGRILESGSIDDIKQNLEENQSFTLSAIEPQSAFEEFLSRDPHVSKYSLQERENSVDYRITVKTNDEVRPFIIQNAVGCNVNILSVHKNDFSLEEYFLKVTND